MHLPYFTVTTSIRAITAAIRSTVRGTAAAGLLAFVAACGSEATTPTTPTPPPAPSVTVRSVAVLGTSSFTAQGATAQFTAQATLSDGTTQDRSSAATWQSTNAAVATVSEQGLVRALGNGATTISATVSAVAGTREVTVNIPAPINRTPDPGAGQRLPLPDIQAFVQAAAAARPDLLGQSCPVGLKYVNNPWLDYMVDRLRTLDSRWGYNAKPTRSASDNNGVAVVAAGDEVAYHFGAGPDQGSADVYLIDILEGHCGPTPRVTFRVFTGEEPGRWTGAGRF